jgi:hypothetical protein
LKKLQAKYGKPRAVAEEAVVDEPLEVLGTDHNDIQNPRRFRQWIGSRRK